MMIEFCYKWSTSFSLSLALAITLSLSLCITLSQGGVVLVSHDERLIREVCKELWVCEGGKVKRIDGGFDEYRDILHEQFRKEGYLWGLFLSPAGQLLITTVAENTHHPTCQQNKTLYIRHAKLPIKYRSTHTLTYVRPTAKEHPKDSQKGGFLRPCTDTALLPGLFGLFIFFCPQLRFSGGSRQDQACKTLHCLALIASPPWSHRMEGLSQCCLWLFCIVKATLSPQHQLVKTLFKRSFIVILHPCSES